MGDGRPSLRVTSFEFDFMDDPGMPERPEWNKKQFDMDNKVKA